VRRPDPADGMLVAANVIWSLNYATTKYAFERWSPIAFSGLRFATAGIALALIVRLREGGIGVERRDVRLVVLCGIVGIFLNQLTFTYAVDYTAAANVALILASAPAFAAVFAVVLGHERVRPAHWLALAVSLAGVALVVVGGSNLAGFSLRGDLLAVGAALTWAAYTVMLRPLFGRYSAGRISALVILTGAAVMAPVTAVQVAHQDFGALTRLDWGAWVYSTIGPLLVTNWLYFRSLHRVGAARATLYMYLQPFLGAVFAAWLLGEKLVAVQLVGGAVIVGGVALGRAVATRRAPADELEPPGEPS
jgi:drug/metabolite transporter (DMT)-like permease